MPPKAPLANRLLPAKESKLFREILSDYENRAYKKALKSCEAILKKSPQHGETLCMKGIVIYHMGRKEEGMDLVRRGTELDITSHICWHVKALVHKSEKDLEQAMACYIQALKIDKDQVNVMRDLVLIMMQFRLYSDAIEHRIGLVRTQPKQRVNWIGLAVVYHLAGEHEQAHEILTRFEDMQAGDTPRHDFETSEIVLFHALVLEDAGKAEEALALLERKAAYVVDRPALERAKARLYGKTGSTQSATLAWGGLLDANSDSYDNLKGLLHSHGFDLDALPDEARARCLELLDETAARHPRSLVVRRTALQVAQGDAFRRRADVYLTDFLVKGIPSLYIDIRHLYADRAKRDTIEQLVESYWKSIAETGSLRQEASEGDGRTEDAPTAFLWVAYFLAQHYSGIGRHTQALEFIDKAIAHTPSLPDFHLVRGRILKRAGDRYGAERSVDAARALDGQDRYLNCKTAKYLCRAGKPEDAEKMVGLFTRAEALSPLSDLLDMQALWFLQEQGESFRLAGKPHLALKRFHQVEKIFSDWSDDEYDFHSWCIRKYTLRAYISMIKWEDGLRTHEAFYRAASNACEIYLDLHKRQTALANGHLVNGEAEAAARAEEERKKAEKKAKKASAKAKAADNKKPAAPAADNSTPIEDLGPPKDLDPEGHTLIATKEPLVVAQRFVDQLKRMVPKRISTWLLAARLAFAQQRPLEAIAALTRARQINPTDVELHVQIAALRHLVSTSDNALAKEAAKDLLEAPSTEAANAELLQRHAGSPTHIFAAARALLAGQGSKQDAEALLFQLLASETQDDVATCQSAFVVLERELASARLSEFRTKAHERYPLATTFLSPDELKAHLAALNPTPPRPDQESAL